MSEREAAKQRAKGLLGTALDNPAIAEAIVDALVEAVRHPDQTEHAAAVEVIRAYGAGKDPVAKAKGEELPAQPPATADVGL